MAFKKLLIVSMLIGTLSASGCDQIKNNNDLTPLMLAVINQQPATVNSLILNGANTNNATKSGNTALIFAAAVNNADIIKILVQNGADVNAKNNEGITPLLAASGAGNTDIKQLLALGADFCAQDNHHLNATQIAENWGNHDTALFLQNYQRLHAINCGNNSP